MVRVHAALAQRGLRAQLLLMVHDELVLEAAEGEVAAVARLVKEEMEAAAQLRVPLKVGVEAGYSWGQMEDAEEVIAAAAEGPREEAASAQALLARLRRRQQQPAPQ